MRHEGLTRWHYTTETLLAQILADGYIRPATGHIEAHERAAVWFSANQAWEETANKGMVNLADADGRTVTLTREQTYQVAGLARIGVRAETAPHDWDAYRRLSGVRPRVARSLYEAAIAVRARPGEWFVSFGPVAASDWVAVEVWDGAGWAPAPIPREVVTAH